MGCQNFAHLHLSQLFISYLTIILQCEKGGMCWDNSINKCLCTNLVCPHKHFQSICTSQSQEIICNPAVSLEVYPDSNNCERYFFCVFGRHYHHKCENGKKEYPNPIIYRPGISKIFRLLNLHVIIFKFLYFKDNNSFYFARFILVSYT